MAQGTWGSGGTDIHPLQVKISFRLGTSVAMTGFKLRDSSLTPSNPQACADEVADFVNASFRTILLTADQLIGVDVLDLTTGEAGGVSFSNVTGTIAASADQATPSFITAVVSMKSQLRRRYGQGRMLWPVRSEGHLSSDLLSPAVITAYEGVITEMSNRYLGAGGSTDYTLITAHGVIPPRAASPTAPARPEVPASWYDVTTLRLNTVPSFLRSRKQGVGS
jgi:hypothetical protein